MKVQPSTRVVLVIGRRTRLNAGGIERAAAGASCLVLLSLGYPVSKAQRRAVDAALEIAGRLDVTLDARLVTDPSDLSELVTNEDRAILSGSRAERRRLRSILSSP